MLNNDFVKGYQEALRDFDGVISKAIRTYGETNPHEIKNAIIAELYVLRLKATVMYDSLEEECNCECKERDMYDIEGFLEFLRKQEEEMVTKSMEEIINLLRGGK